MAIERIMAGESGSSPDISSSAQASAKPEDAVVSRPWHISPEFNPGRAGEYTVKKEGNYNVFVDPVTDKEVARILEVAGGAIVSEAELDPERAKGPDGIVDLLLTIDNMEPGKRKDYELNFQQAVDIWIKFTDDNKLLGFEWEVSELDRQLNKYDQREISQLEKKMAGQGEKLQQLLYRLDAAELFLSHYDESFANNVIKDLSTDEEWKAFQAQKQKYDTEKANLRQQITDLTNSNFLSHPPDPVSNDSGGRDEQKQAIDEKKVKLEEKKELQRIEEASKRSTEQDPGLQLLERQILIDKHPGNVLAEDTFAKQIALYETQEISKKRVGISFDSAVLDKAEEGLSLYFHESRKLGNFDDLEDMLRQQYTLWVDSMSPPHEITQFRGVEGLMQHRVQKSYPEVRKEVIVYFSALLNKTLPDYIEHPVIWEQIGRVLESRKVDDSIVTGLSGIRTKFMERAQKQILDSLVNYIPGQSLPLPKRVSGEFNVRILDREIKIRQTRQELKRQAEPLYERESYYRIVLKGANRKEIELGADQAAEDIMRGFNDFDFDAIKIRIQTLSEAIQGRRELIRATEGNIPESEAQAIVDSIKDRVENKVNFHLMAWAGGNLQMGLFDSLFARYVQSRGVERIKEIPGMVDGWAGVAILKYLSRKYRLYFRPQGWKGQMKDEDTAHKALRYYIEKRIENELMGYELKESERGNLTKVRNSQDFLKRFEIKGLIKVGNQYLTYEQYLGLQDAAILLVVPDLKNPGKNKDYKILSLAEYGKIEIFLTVAQRSSYRDDYYDHVLYEVQKKDNNIEDKDLDNLIKAREAQVSAYFDYQNTKDRIASAVTIAKQVLDISGESAEMGDPSIIMKESEDFISLRELTLACKAAILDAGAADAADTDGKKYKVKDSMANIRERRKAWLKKAARAGYDRSKVSENDSSFSVTLPAGKQVIIKLAKGFEETGLTQYQFDKLKEAWMELNKNGFCAEINGIKFQEIIRREDLKPLKNNYLADYKSSMSQINSQEVRDKVAKGQLPVIENILVRLGFKDQKKISGTTQQEIDQYTQVIEDSRSFDAMVERLVYYMATHPVIDKLEDGSYPDFTPDAIDFGFQNLNWGVKRLRHLRAFWLTNLNRTVPGGVDLIDMMPALDRLAGEMDFENIFDLALNTNTSTNGMESVDNPALIQFASRIENMVYLRSKSEGSIGKGEGGIDKDWGSFEKWLVDANGLWKAMKGKLPNIATIEALHKLLQDPRELGESNAEELVDALTGVLGRFKPLLTGNEALLGENRQALSAGSGYEDNEYKIFRFSEFMRSEKGVDDKESNREQGGSVVQKEIREIIRLMMMPGTFTPRIVHKMEKGKIIPVVVNGKKVIDLEKSPSIWEETMRKLTPSHNPRLPGRVPSYKFYEIITA